MCLCVARLEESNAIHVCVPEAWRERFDRISVNAGDIERVCGVGVVWVGFGNSCKECAVFCAKTMW